MTRKVAFRARFFRAVHSRVERATRRDRARTTATSIVVVVNARAGEDDARFGDERGARGGGCEGARESRADASSLRTERRARRSIDVRRDSGIIRAVITARADDDRAPERSRVARAGDRRPTPPRRRILPSPRPRLDHAHTLRYLTHPHASTARTRDRVRQSSILRASRRF